MAIFRRRPHRRLPSRHSIIFVVEMWRFSRTNRGQRLLSSSYRGNLVPEKVIGNSERPSFRKVREQLARPVAGRSVGSVPNRLLFQREEAIAARFLGPLSVFNVGGALVFCATVVKGSGDEESNEPDGDRFLSRDSMRTLACAVALCSAAGVVYAAFRFNRARLIELRQVGQSIQLYTRSMAGIPSKVLALEVPVKGIAFDYSRMSAAAKVRQEYIGKTVTRKNDDSFVSINILTPDRARVEENAGFTIDTLDASVLDSDGLRSIAMDSSTLPQRHSAT